MAEPAAAAGSSQIPYYKPFTFDERKKYSILSIGGGGAKGLIAAILLAKIEEYTKTYIPTLFSHITGTSIGAFLANLLACPNEQGTAPKFTAKQISTQFKEQIAAVFTNPLLRKAWTLWGLRSAEYDPKYLIEQCTQCFGNSQFSAALTEVITPVMDVQRKKIVHLNSTNFKDKQWPLTCVEATRACTGAPTYFPLSTVTVGNKTIKEAGDAGLAENDPALFAYNYVKKIASIVKDIFLLQINFGGDPTIKGAENWGDLQWADKAVDESIDTVVSDEIKILKQEIPAENMLCLNIEIPPEHGKLDDVTPENLEFLAKLAEKIWELNKEKIIAFLQKISVRP